MIRVFTPTGLRLTFDQRGWELYQQYTWAPSNSGYLSRKQWLGENLRPRMRTVYYHREFLGAGGGEIVDHINRDRLDNRRSNLRIVSQEINVRNGRKMRNTSSVYKGVAWAPREQKWRAYIRLNGRQRSLGYYNTQVEAAKAFDQAVREHFGEKVYLNFPSWTKL